MDLECKRLIESVNEILYFRILTIGGIVSIISVYIAIKMNNPNLFFLIYAVGFGLGKGFMYPSALYAGWSHLPARKGLVSGIIVAGMGIGSFIFGIVTHSLVNPENV